MKFFASVALFIAAVSAQTATAPASPTATGCPADYIVTTCLDTENAKVQTCQPTDYACLCAAYNAVLTCYNNCPDDVRRPSAQNQADSYCRTASLLATTSVAVKTTASGSASVAPSVDVSTLPGITVIASTATGSSSAAKASSTSHNAAAGLAANGILAVAGAVAAAML